MTAYSVQVPEDAILYGVIQSSTCHPGSAGKRICRAADLP